MLSGGEYMLEDELPPRREALVEGESLCTRTLYGIVGQAHVEDLLEIVRAGPPGIVWEQLSLADVVRVLHPTSLEGMEGVLCA